VAGQITATHTYGYAPLEQVMVVPFRSQIFLPWVVLCLFAYRESILMKLAITIAIRILMRNGAGVKSFYTLGLASDFIDHLMARSPDNAIQYQSYFGTIGRD
jgi:hypothetical protein